MENKDQIITFSQFDNQQDKILTQQKNYQSFFDRTTSQSLQDPGNLTPIETEKGSCKANTQCEQCKKVPERKRQRERPETFKGYKQKTLDNYWPSQPIPTLNRFSELDND